jgi:glycosyltransferase involved in cell wall biosynthesis
VDPNDRGEIAAHLRHILTNDSLRTNLGQAARAQAERSFHPARVAERTIRVYEGAVAAFSRRQPSAAGAAMRLHSPAHKA